MENTFSLRDLQNPHNADKLNKVLSCARAFRNNYVDQIILEKFGAWLNQTAWTDETGWHITFRCDPLTVGGHVEKRTALVHDFLACLDTVFMTSKARRTVTEMGPELTSEIKVIYHTGTNSIGD